MGDVWEFVARSSRWRALRHNRDYVADWRAHAGEPPLEPAPFHLRTQTIADLGAERSGGLEPLSVAGAGSGPPQATSCPPPWSESEPWTSGRRDVPLGGRLTEASGSRGLRRAGDAHGVAGYDEADDAPVRTARMAAVGALV